MYTVQGIPRRAHAAALATVLARARLGNDALGAKLLRKQRLSDRIIDLVRTGVRKILALQPQLRAPGLRQPCCVRHRRGATHPRGKLVTKALLKLRARKMCAHAALEPLERGDERLRHVGPAKRTKAPASVGKLAGDGIGEQPFHIDGRHGCNHDLPS